MRKSLIVTILLLMSVSCFMPSAAATPYRVGTVVFQVGASSDDAYYSNMGVFNSISTYINIKDKIRENYVGLRFSNVSIIPSNASIVSAYLSFYTAHSQDSFQALGVTIYGIDVDEVSTFDNSSMILQNITLAYKTFNTKDMYGSRWVNSTDLKAVIDEIRARPSFNASAGLGFRIMSVPTTNQYDRDFLTYDYGASYAPKLVITFSIPYTSPPYKMGVWANTTWLCQNGTSTDYIYVNSTATYEVFEVWNDTRTYGWIGVHDDTTDHFHIYNPALGETDLTALGVPLSMGLAVSQTSYCRDADGNTYFVATMDLATDEVVLFRIASATSVVKVKTIKAAASVSVPYCIYKSNSNQIWVFWFNGATQQYAVYDLDDDSVTASAQVVTFTLFGSAYASEDGSHIYYVGEYANKYGWAKYEDGVGWSAITQLLPTDCTFGMLAGISSGSTVHLYAVLSDVGADCRGFYMDSDESWGTLEAIHAGTTISYPVQAQFAYGDPETVYLYWYCTDATPDCIYHKDRLGGKTGSSFGGTSQIISEDTTGGTYGSSTLYEGGFYMAFGSATTGKQSVMVGDHGTPSDIDTDNIRSAQPFIIGELTAHTYDIHYFNCTWVYHNPTPYIDDDLDDDDDGYDDDDGDVDDIQKDINDLLNADNLLLLIGLMGVVGVPVSISVSLGLIREGQYANALGVLILGIMGSYTMIVTWLGS